jgi:hypothetical protein
LSPRLSARALLLIIALPPAGHARADDRAPIRYSVRLIGEVIEAEAELPPGPAATLAVPAMVTRAVEHVERQTGTGWVPLSRDGEGWTLPEHGAAKVRIRYRFALGRAADEAHDVDVAARAGAAIVAPPSTWLLRPASATLPFQLEMSPSDEARFVTALAVVGPATHGGVFTHGYVAPYAAFGPFLRERFAVGGGQVWLAMATPALDDERPRIRAWVEAAGRAVSAYFGQLPQRELLVLVVEKRQGVHGKQMGDGAASVLLQIAPGADLEDLEWDWVATHEMVHLAAPDLPRRQLWMSEGLATYVEPLGRVQTGELSPARVWGDLVHGLPKGLPAPGDRGFDRSASWGTTYWGGALFFLKADIEIRRLTGGKKSLRSALQAVLAAGGDSRQEWPVARFLDVADRSVGQPVLRPLYQQMGLARHAIDLDRLWADLGVRVEGGTIRFDDQAPLAAIRRAITAREPASMP